MARTTNRTTRSDFSHSRSEKPPRGFPEVLQSSLGLKPAAAKLVAALAFDDDLKSYAQREGISINTVRFHLSSALAQTETRTQAELLRLVVGILRDLTLREKR